jgi:uncharacterized membrane protein YccC
MIGVGILVLGLLVCILGLIICIWLGLKYRDNNDVAGVFCILGIIMIVLGIGATVEAVKRADVIENIQVPKNR